MKNVPFIRNFLNIFFLNEIFKYFLWNSFFSKILLFFGNFEDNVSEILILPEYFVNDPFLKIVFCSYLKIEEKI